MLTLIISSVIIGVGTGMAIAHLMDIVDDNGNGSVAWLILGIVMVLIGAFGYYIVNVI